MGRAATSSCSSTIHNQHFEQRDPATAGDAFAPESTVCWCNGVTVEAITASAAAGNDTVACIGSATRAGTGCGGCKGRIGEVLERFAAQSVP